MRGLRLPLAMMACMPLLGCGQMQSSDCSSEEALTLVSELLKEDVSDDVRKIMAAQGYARASSETVGAALAAIEIALKGIRTTSLDKDVGIRTCAAEVEISFPQNVIDDADEALIYISYSNVDELADVAGFRSRGRTFTRELEFEMQPTDSDDGLFVEVTDVSPPAELMAHLVTAHLVLPEIRSREAIATAEADRRERELVQAQEAATTALLAEANAQKTLTEQSINAVWSALPEKTRADLLQVQRAWIRRKTAECRMEGASASVVEPEQRAIAAQCEARYNNDRERFLRQYLAY